MLSGRGLCDELITRPEESYRLCCVVVCVLETSRIGAPYIYDISNLRVKSPSKCHSVKFSVEVSSADAGAAAVYPAELQVMTEDGNHSPDLIFKVDETEI